MPEIPFVSSVPEQHHLPLHPIGLVLHRTEASYDHLYDAFQVDVKAPHFMIGKNYGQVVQFVNTDFRGVHVGSANSYYIGIEFESIAARPGYEHSQDPLVIMDDLTVYQTWMGYKIVDWVCRTHGIPKVGPPSRSQWLECHGHWQGVLGHATVASGNFFTTTHGDTLQGIDFNRLGVFNF